MKYSKQSVIRSTSDNKNLVGCSYFVLTSFYCTNKLYGRYEVCMENNNMMLNVRMYICDKR